MKQQLIQSKFIFIHEARWARSHEGGMYHLFSAHAAAEVLNPYQDITISMTFPQYFVKIFGLDMTINPSVPSYSHPSLGNVGTAGLPTPLEMQTNRLKIAVMVFPSSLGARDMDV